MTTRNVVAGRVAGALDDPRRRAAAAEHDGELAGRRGRGGIGARWALAIERNPLKRKLRAFGMYPK